MVNLFDQEQVIAFISATVHEVTGLRPQEKEDNETFVLKLGHVDNIEIGFNKVNHPELTEFRYSAYVTLLGVIQNYLKEPEQLQYWISLQTNSN